MPGQGAPGMAATSPKGGKERGHSTMLAELNTLGWRCALAAGVLGVGLLLSGPSLAAEEEEETFEQSVLRNLLGGGSRPDVEYRERSPLVLPPSRDLPAPDSAARVEQT